VVTALEAGPSAVAAERGECVACGRGYGRLRVPAGHGGEPANAEVGLWGCGELVVCDQCWHLAGGTAGVAARLDAAGDALEPVLVLAPEIEALLAEAADFDLLHPLDRLLVDSGVRWAVLRHIAVPARMTLAGWVMRSVAPDGSRSADSARLWLDEVEARIRGQSSGAGFVYTARKRRWWRIAHQLACAAAWERRPLTWMAQEDLAAAVGCSTRTVRRVVAWLRAEGLLWEVVPGCRLPQQHVPDDENPHETAQRRQRMSAAISAEQAAIARAHAELNAVRGGHHGAEDAEIAIQVAAQPILGQDDPVTDPTGDPALDTLVAELLEPVLVNLAPVYELRLPVAVPELAHSPTNNDQEEALTCINADLPPIDTEFGHPPQVCNQDQMKSRSVQPVDNKRRAPRGPDEQEFDEVDRCLPGAGTADSGADPVSATPTSAPAGDRLPARQSEAVRAAQWLLRSRLDPDVCDGVSVRWLAAQIRGAHLLDRHDWTWEDLADLLHGAPEHLHLPRWIRNPRGWIRARITAATPTLPPRNLRIVLDIERGSDLLRQRRQAEQHEAARAEIASRRAAIGACRFCDDLGWFDLGPDAPTARCNHNPDTSGW